MWHLWPKYWSAITSYLDSIALFISVCCTVVALLPCFLKHGVWDGKTYPGKLKPDTFTSSFNPVKSKKVCFFATPHAFMGLCNRKGCSLHLTFLLQHAYTVCLCHCAFNHFWRHGRRLLWLAGVMPAAVEPRAELFASSQISSPITEQSACPDSLLSAAASPAPIPLLPSSAVGFHLSAICFLPQPLCIIKKEDVSCSNSCPFLVGLAFKGFFK